MASYKPVPVLGIPLEVSTSEYKGRLKLFMSHFNRPMTPEAARKLSAAKNEACLRVVTLLMKVRSCAKIEVESDLVWATPLGEGGLTLEEFDALVREALVIR